MNSQCVRKGSFRKELFDNLGRKTSGLIPAHSWRAQSEVTGPRKAQLGQQKLSMVKDTRPGGKN